ncbi:TetR/AcrR family transcriptional regulator [soil metagenome]
MTAVIEPPSVPLSAGALPPRAQRIEIRRSRDQILRAAEQYVQTHSTGPSMSDLATLAGVGNATLWRRFSSMDGVIAALYERMSQRLQVVADAAFSQPTGWGGVVALITGVAELIENNPAIARVAARMAEIDPEQHFGAQWVEGIDVLARRAREEGELRHDVSAVDLVLAAFRRQEMITVPQSMRARLIARQTAIVLDGLRVEGRRPPLPGNPVDRA